MVLCIISATFTIGLLVVGILGAVYTNERTCDYTYDYGYYYNEYSYYPNYRYICSSVVRRVFC